MRARITTALAEPGYRREQGAAEALVRAQSGDLGRGRGPVAPGDGERVDAAAVGEDGGARGVGDGGWEGECVGAGCDVDDAVQGVEVGGQASIVLFRGEDEFCEALDGVGRVLGEEGGEGRGYGTEELFDLRWVLGVWRRIFFVCGLRRGCALLACGFGHLRWWRRGRLRACRRGVWMRS